MTTVPQGKIAGDSFTRWSTAVGSAIGDEMALTARLSADEKVDGGLGIDDAVELAKRLEMWGVHAVHIVTGSACDSPPWYYQHMALPPGINESLAARIRSSVSIPVIAAGRLGEPERIREILDTSMADVIALGRPLVADPDLPQKMQRGARRTSSPAEPASRGVWPRSRAVGRSVASSTRSSAGNSRWHHPPPPWICDWSS